MTHDARHRIASWPCPYPISDTSAAGPQWYFAHICPNSIDPNLSSSMLTQYRSGLKARKSPADGALFLDCGGDSKDIPIPRRSL
jgi:hypothetical protein